MVALTLRDPTPWRIAVTTLLVLLLAVVWPLAVGGRAAAPVLAQAGGVSPGGSSSIPLALVQEGSKLTGGEENGEGRFGFSVAISADGDTALIGGYSDDGGVGAAWVFVRSGTTWVQQGIKLTAAGESGDALFGRSVALSADGDTALIGGPNDDNQTGAAWVFTRSGTTWTQQGEKLTGGGERGPALFGVGVALSADGDTALIGGEADSEYFGAAWVFTRSGSTWTQQGAKLMGTGEIEGGQIRSGRLGYSVALSADGNTALVGGYGDDVSIGAAWVFTRSGSTWTQQGPKLTGSQKYGRGEFGYSVALSGDGNTALIGGPYDNGEDGAVWLFSRAGSTWTQDGPKLTGAKSGKSRFGAALALSESGETALVGGYSDQGQTGAMWVFGPSQSVALAPTTVAVTPTTTPPTPPTVTNLLQSHRRWREGGALAHFARRRSGLPPVGTTFSFTLNESATVTFAFTQQQGGRMARGKCVAATSRSRHLPACRRVVTPATLSFAGHAAANRVSFQGQASSLKKLSPGRYTLVVTAANPAGHSGSVSLDFAIVR